MKRLSTLWPLAIGIALGALMALTLIQFTGRMSTFLMWLILFAIGASLTFYTVRVRQPAKRPKPIPRRKSSNVARRNIKVVKSR